MVALRILFLIVGSVLLCPVGAAQDPVHTQESVERRYMRLKCALVLVQSPDRFGTGFYVSPDGDVVTALHVLGDIVYTPLDNGTTNVTLNHPHSWKLTNGKNEEINVPEGSLEVDGGEWGAGIARLKTNKPPPCWLPIGNDKNVRPGQHVITLGFPGLASGSLIIYTGMVSARMKSAFPMGVAVTGKTVRTVQFTGDILRVEMPLSPGLSGAPLINDKNRAVAVINSAGAWNPELEAFVRDLRTGSLHPDPNSLEARLASVLSSLLVIYHEFASPGYGDAVPLSNLKRRPIQKLGSSGHPPG